MGRLDKPHATDFPEPELFGAGMHLLYCRAVTKSRSCFERRAILVLAAFQNGAHFWTSCSARLDSAAAILVPLVLTTKATFLVA